MAASISDGGRTLQASSSSSPCPAPEPPKHGLYDAFVSFSGEDARFGFISHLDRRLRENNIDAFIDYRIKRGDEIKFALDLAIERSRMAVIIFSREYASSSWCLDELEMIIDHNRNPDKAIRRVIPVCLCWGPKSLRVTFDDVFDTNEGAYKDAFQKHEREKDADKVNKWKEAMSVTAGFAGLVFVLLVFAAIDT